MKKLLALLMASVLCAAALTACGDTTTATTEGEESTSTATTESEESTSTEVTEGEESTSAATADSEESASAEEPEKSVLIVGTNAEFPPFEYIGDDGEPDGFDIALIKAIGEKLGMEVQVENMEFASLVAAIGNKIDLAIAGMSVMPDREDAVDFSDSYYEAVQNVIVLADSSIASAADLENKTIGVQMGTTGQYTAEEIPGVTVQAYNKGVDAVNDLINGRVDAVIIDRNPAQVFASKFEGQIVALEGDQFDFEIEDYAIALPKGSDLVEKVNQALVDLKEDGTYDALVAQYIEAE